MEQHTKRTNNSDATNQTDWHKDYFTAVKYTSATHKNKYKGKKGYISMRWLLGNKSLSMESKAE